MTFGQSPQWVNWVMRDNTRTMAQIGQLAMQLNGTQMVEVDLTSDGLVTPRMATMSGSG